MTIIDTANALLKDKEDEKPTRKEAENAVKVLIEWAGDDPSREGLIETPKRVVKAFEEYFAGYSKNPQKILEKTFFETGNYQEFVLLNNIEFRSHCEHHLAPIIGVAKVAYLPSGLVVGIWKLVRVVDTYAKRLQIQERLTREIGLAINDTLKPRGVAVAIKAEHHCMCTRGVNKPGAKMLTSSFIGEAENNQEFRRSFLEIE